MASPAYSIECIFDGYSSLYCIVLKYRLCGDGEATIVPRVIHAKCIMHGLSRRQRLLAQPIISQDENQYNKV